MTGFYQLCIIEVLLLELIIASLKKGLKEVRHLAKTNFELKEDKYNKLKISLFERSTNILFDFIENITINKTSLKAFKIWDEEKWKIMIFRKQF